MHAEQARLRNDDVQAPILLLISQKRKVRLREVTARSHRQHTASLGVDEACMGPHALHSHRASCYGTEGSVAKEEARDIPVLTALQTQ